MNEIHPVPFPLPRHLALGAAHVKHQSGAWAIISVAVAGAQSLMQGLLQHLPRCIVVPGHRNVFMQNEAVRCEVPGVQLVRDQLERFLGAPGAGGRPSRGTK